MKRVVAATVLIAIAIAVAVWSNYSFSNKINSVEKSLDGLIQIAENSSEETLVEETEKLVAQWKKAEGLLHSMVIHDGIDELGRYIASLPQIIRYSGKEEMLIRCIEAIKLIENLKKCEKINFENIL